MQDKDKSGFTFILHKTIMDADFNFVITRSLVIKFIKHTLNNIEFFLIYIMFHNSNYFKYMINNYCHYLKK